jgi:hypothetical protein
MGSLDIPKTQTVALVRALGGEVEFKTDYPVPTPGRNEVLAKVLYTGVCQSGMYTPVHSIKHLAKSLKINRSAYQIRHRGWTRW